jgi:MiaB/RimO family radical SAM methylthiotransferase
VTDNPADADVLLVNTCAVRDNAEQRVIGRMGELKRHKRPGVVLGVVGCMAQRLGETMLAQAPHVDLVVGPDGYRGLPALIASAADGTRVADVEFKGWEHYEDVPAQRAAGQPSAFVTVQRGCDYRCTFCIVPMTRGRERSRILQDVVTEVEGLADQGVTEVTLLGQTVNSYHDGTHDFADLLRAVGVVRGIRRVRFTSPYPNDFTDRAVAAMAEVDTVCEHVHLPVQSGSSSLLKRMGRRYDRDEYLACVDRLRTAVPDIAITTDIIVGFPGETDADFDDTISLVHAVGVHVPVLTARRYRCAATAASGVGGGSGCAAGAPHRRSAQRGPEPQPPARGDDARSAGRAAGAPRGTSPMPHARQQGGAGRGPGQLDWVVPPGPPGWDVGRNVYGRTVNAGPGFGRHGLSRILM